MVHKDLKDIPEAYRDMLTEMYQNYLKATSATQDQIIKNTQVDQILSNK